jgi:CHASE2 domain-containing sensor protein
MEIVLLWLDDLDDLLFSVALRWERARRAFLEVGLLAAVALAASERMHVAADWAPLFANVAAASVAAWALGAAFRLYYYRHRLATA